MTAHTPGKFGNFDGPFCDELAGWLDGRRVLETFAGNGLLSSMLASRNVSIVSTTTFSGHDGHRYGMHHDVIEMDAVAAVARFGGDCDVLVLADDRRSDDTGGAPLGAEAYRLHRRSHRSLPRHARTGRMRDGPLLRDHRGDRALQHLPAEEHARQGSCSNGAKRCTRTDRTRIRSTCLGKVAIDSR